NLDYQARKFYFLPFLEELPKVTQPGALSANELIFQNIVLGQIRHLIALCVAKARLIVIQYANVTEDFFLRKIRTNVFPAAELIYVLSFLTIIFAVGFAVLTIKTIKKCFPERRFFSSCTSVQQSKKQLASKTADKTKNSLLDIKEEMILGTMQVLPLSQAQGQELPDCIKSARETRISDSPVVLYAVMDAVPVLRWKEFMRYLGLSENTIDRIFLDHRHARDAQYETLKEWRLLANHDATMERISQVLSKMDLSGCIEEIQEALAKQ
ncbi:Tumor necrosis factor receptor superfamily member 1A, partial [Ophiophagus hannah]